MEMSFREKSAWISLVLILLVFGPYFWLVGRSFAGVGHVHAGTQFALIPSSSSSRSSCTSRLRVQSPRDARAPKDEREILIDLRATRTAFYVLFVGALFSIFTMHFRFNVWQLSQFDAALDRGRRAREVRPPDRPLPPGLLTWVAARFATPFVTCASTTAR